MSAARKTFQAFVQGREFFTGASADDFHRRIRRETKIDSLYKLYAWCRIRYPDFYRDHQPFLGCSGKQQMARLWASYLEAVES